MKIYRAKVVREVDIIAKTKIEAKRILKEQTEFCYPDVLSAEVKRSFISEYKFNDNRKNIVQSWKD